MSLRRYQARDGPRSGVTRIVSAEGRYTTSQDLTGFPYRDDALVNRARAFKASVDEINDSTNREAYSPRNDQASYTSPRGCEHEQ